MRRALLFALMLGCAPETGVDGGPVPDAHESRSTAARRSASAFGTFDYGTAPDGIDGIDVEACGRCHARHADEWRTSAHAMAFTDPLFVREWTGDTFCSDCHAPRTRDLEGEPARAAAGVDCAACHAREGRVVSARVSARAPHPSVADPERRAAGLCGTCHQFDFPHDPSIAMQDTVREWQASGLEEGCVGCHAPHRDGHTDHAFVGHRDPELLSQALRVHASTTRDGWSTDVVLRLSAHRVGHAVPTGDVFRRLEVRAWVQGRPENAASTLLSRGFDVRGGRWTPSSDLRVPGPGGGERVVTLRVPDSGARVVWTIDLWSLEPSHANELDPDLTLRTRVATGVVTRR